MVRLTKSSDNRKDRDMSEKHLDPAKSVIAKIGIGEVSAITGKHISRVYRWMYPRHRGGTGGIIPQADAFRLLAHARATGLDLKPDDFFSFAEAAE
jgi:hypothetical protein